MVHKREASRPAAHDIDEQVQEDPDEVRGDGLRRGGGGAVFVKVFFRILYRFTLFT